MFELFSFSVFDSSDSTALSPYVERKDFLRFVQYAKKHNLDNIMRGGKLVPNNLLIRNPTEQQFRCEPENPSIPKLFEMLDELGWKLHEGYVDESRKKEYYTYEIYRHFAAKDISACSYLYLDYVASKGGDGGIVDFVEKLEAGWVGKSRRLERSEKFLFTGANNFFFEKELAKSFQDCVGIRFGKTLEWKGKNVGEFLEFDSSLTLPKCDLPVVQMDDIKKFEEGFYRPPILRYSKQDFDELGKFDVAKVQESQGGRPGDKEQAFVISLNFYKKLVAVGASTSVHPVMLV